MHACMHAGFGAYLRGLPALMPAPSLTSRAFFFGSFALLVQAAALAGAATLDARDFGAAPNDGIWMHAGGADILQNLHMHICR